MVAPKNKEEALSVFQDLVTRMPLREAVAYAYLKSGIKANPFDRNQLIIACQRNQNVPVLIEQYLAKHSPMKSFDGKGVISNLINGATQILDQVNQGFLQNGSTIQQPIITPPVNTPAKPEKKPLIPEKIFGFPSYMVIMAVLLIIVIIYMYVTKRSN